MDEDGLHIRTLVKDAKHFLGKPFPFKLPDIPSECQKEDQIVRTSENDFIGLSVHDSEYVREGFFHDLPNKTFCKICRSDLSHQKAQWDLNTPMGIFKIAFEGITGLSGKVSKVEQLFLIRYPAMPVIFMETLDDGKEGIFVVCQTTSCLMAANTYILDYIKKANEVSLECQGRLLQCDYCLLRCGNGNDVFQIYLKVLH